MLSDLKKWGISFPRKRTNWRGGGGGIDSQKSKVQLFDQHRQKTLYEFTIRLKTENSIFR